MRSLAWSLLALSIGLSACGVAPGRPLEEICAGVVCGNGRCVAEGDAPRCECDPGFDAQGLICVPQAGNPCAENPCTEPNRGVCSLENGEVRCGCDAGYVATAEGCRPVAECESAPGDGGDAWEPDGCMGLGQTLEASETPVEGHTLAPGGDVDWFPLATSPGHVYVVRVFSPGPPLMLDVVRGGTTIATDESARPVLEARFGSGSGSLAYARVRAVREGETTPYSIQLVDLGPDDFVDTPAGAPRLAPTHLTGLLQYRGDRDVLGLGGLAGNAYAVTVTWERADALTVELLNGEGTVLERYSGRDLRFVLPARREDLWIGISSPSFGPDLRWVLTTSDLGPDDHGDLIAAATAIDASQEEESRPVRFERALDVDLMRFEATADHFYAADCFYCGANVRDATGKRLFGYASSRVAFRARSSGPMFLELSSQSASGEQTWSLRDLGPDDHGDLRSTASPAPMPGAFAGALTIATDVDVFELPLVAAETYLVRCTPAVNLSLTTRDGAVLASPQVNYSSSETWIGLESVSAGPVYLVVSSYFAEARAYSCTTEANGPDDAPDTAAEAELVSLPFEASRETEFPGDVDAFAFDAVEGTVYRVALSGGGAVQATGTGPGGEQVLVHQAQTPYVASFKAAETGRHLLVIEAKPPGQWTLGIESLGADDHPDEPKDATVVPTLPASGTGSFEFTGDRDAFRFEATAGQVYRATCSAGGAPCRVEFYDSLQARTVTSTASDGARFEASSSGPLFVVFSRLYTGDTYSWNIEAIGVDDHGDEGATASGATVGTSFSGTLEWSGDVDAFAVPVIAGRAYRTLCSPAVAGLVVTDAAGAGLATSYPFQVATDQSVVILVKQSESASYTCTVEDLGADDHGGTVATATGFPAVPGTLAGRIGARQDSDVFTFSAEAGRIYEVKCAGEGTGCAFSMAIASTNATIGTRPYVELAQTELVAVTVGASTWGTQPYSYSLEIVDHGPDDHADARASATPIAPGETKQVLLAPAGDVDFLRFDAVEGHAYRAVCSDTYYCRVALLDSTGTVLLQSFSAGKELAAGTYYLRITGSTTTYEVTLEDRGLDDFGDDAATATQIAIGAPQSLTFETASDTDAFLFDVQPGHHYRLECVSSSSGDPCRFATSGATLHPTSNHREFEGSSAGQVTVLVTPNVLGPVTLTVNDLGLDDHASVLSGATPVALGAWTSGTVLSLADRDWFRIDLEGGRSYRVENVGVGLTLRYAVWAPDRSTLLATGTSPSLGFTTTQSGEYFVELSLQSYSSQQSRPFGYQVKVY